MVPRNSPFWDLRCIDSSDLKVIQVGVINRSTVHDSVRAHNKYAYGYSRIMSRPCGTTQLAHMHCNPDTNLYLMVTCKAVWT